jgi:hypothetical protein
MSKRHAVFGDFAELSDVRRGFAMFRADNAM